MNSFKHWVAIGFIAVLVGVGGWLGYGRVLKVTARENAISAWKTRCVALDIVFVVDQSSSMKWNDPLKNRIYAVQVAMDWLVTNRLGMCPGVVHRVGIVSFGEKAEVDLPLTPLDVNSEEEWQQRKQQLLRNFGPKDLVATDQWAGVRKAKELLDAAPFIKGPYPRKRAIVLLTDGWPCVSALGCSTEQDTMDKEAYMQAFQQWAARALPFSPALREREKALAALRERYEAKNSNIPVQEINQVLAEHRVSEEEMWESVYIWVIAMNDRTDYLQVVGDYLNAIASSHGGALFDLKENRSDVPIEFDRILSRLLNIQPERQQCGGLYVDPYLEALVINVYKNAEGVKVKITSGDYALEGGKDAGQQTGALEYFAQKVIYSSNGEHNEHYTFILPHPGKWEISSSVCDSFQALVLPLDPLVIIHGEAQVFPLYRPQGQKRYDPQHPMYLHFPIFHNSKLVKEYMGQNLPRLVDENQCTWVESGQQVSADCGLTMWAYVHDPLGNETKLRMKYVSETQEWQTEEPVPVDAVGTYEVDVEGWAHCLGDQADQRNKSYCEGGRYTVIPKGSLHLQYQVAETVPVHLKVVAPEDKVEAHDTLWPGKLQVLPFVVTVKAVDENGHAVPAAQVFGSDERPLRATVQIGEDEKEVTLHLSSDGSVLEGKIEDWPVTGEGTAQVRLVGDYDYRHYQLLERTVSAQFVRKDPLWRSPLTYEVLAGLLTLAVAVLIARIIYMRTNAVYGRLVFEPSGGGQAISVPLPRRRFASPKRLPRQLGLTSLKAHLIPGGKGLRVEVKERGKPGKRTVTLKETPSVSIGAYRVHWDSGGRAGRASVSRRTTPARRPRPRQRR